ncbi:MAG: NifU family protein [Candidatus Omnitrophica bacterium]|nr:NifU family protein [Candidatus Omnitrophota bacterium]
MDYRIMIQSTPNPNALKFVLNTAVKNEGNYTYKSAAECAHNPLAKAIFELDTSTREVYFFDNYITVTQNGNADWDALEEKIKNTILGQIKDHNPDFETPTAKEEVVKVADPSNPDIAQINSILDQTVRPALQMDGGDIQLVDYEDNVLRIFYQGACGSCPSSTMGTMMAIENILKDQFNPEISVQLAENVG